MPVAELIEELKKVEQNAEVYFRDVWTDELIRIDTITQEENKLFLF